MFTRSRPIQKIFASETIAVKDLLSHSQNYAALQKMCTPSHLYIIEDIRLVTNFQELLDTLNSYDFNKGQAFLYAPAENIFKKFLYFSGSCFPNAYLQEECGLSLCIMQFIEEIQSHKTDFIQSLGRPYKLKMD